MNIINWLRRLFRPKTVLPPSPDEVALVVLQGLLASGKYGENLQAAAAMAWWVVPFFYTERLNYQTRIAPLHFIQSDEGQPPLTEV